MEIKPARIKPLANRILMVRELEKSTTESGLFIPKGTTEREDVADVLRIGEDVKGIQIGDRVLYKPYSTSEISLDGEEYLII